MGLRLLAIVLLLIQPGQMLAARVDAAGCGVKPCCAVEIRTTCCGQRIAETVCRHSGGACVCAAPKDAPRPDDTPDPRPIQDAPARSLTGGHAGVEVLRQATDVRQPEPVASGALSSLSHNEVRAFLGIWRT
ncbi:MAG: hypothetical protein R3B57_03630 [Phycisphaerales bacterium]